MNSFGRIFNVQIFGESHGSLVGVTINGVPPGVAIQTSDFDTALERRKGTHIIGTTPRKEADTPILQTGVYNNYTTGAPLQIVFENKNVRSQDYEQQQHIPRPSHADWTAHYKFNGFNDSRGGGHFSARLTTGIVAAGVVAQKILATWGYDIHIQTHFITVGNKPTVEEGIAFAIAQKDSVGAVIRCQITNVPAGLGEPFWDSVESVLAHAMFAIPAVKGIEFGAGFAAATMLGKQHNDSIIDNKGTTATNHAGGIVGGITNGNNIIFQLAFKPTASTPQMQESFDFKAQKMARFSIKGRHDLCVALRAPIIIEAMATLVLLDLIMIHKSSN
jgi:chorismate synthase